MARFTLPRDLYHGKGALEALKTFKGKKAIICVGGGSMKRFGFLQKAEDYLKEAGMEVKLFEGIEPDPSVETVMKGAAVMQEFEPDWIGQACPRTAATANSWQNRWSVALASHWAIACVVCFFPLCPGRQQGPARRRASGGHRLSRRSGIQKQRHQRLYFRFGSPGGKLHRLRQRVYPNGRSHQSGQLRRRAV